MEQNREIGERVTDFEPRSRPETGTAVTVFGIVMMLVGLGLVLFVVGRAPAGSGDIPGWVLATVGCVFAAGGVLLVGHSSSAVLRAWSALRLAERAPNQPWVADYRWNPSGGSNSPIGRSFRELVFGFLFVAFLMPFNWVTFASDAPIFFRIPFGTVTMIFNALTVWILVVAVRRGAAALRYGTTTVRFDRFPFFAGESVDLHLALPRRAFAGVTVELRCVQERIEESEESSKVVGYQLYSQSVRVRPAPSGYGSSRLESSVRFVLPPDCPGTALSARPARYWEVVIRPADVDSAYAARVLIPVYRHRSQ